MLVYQTFLLPWPAGPDSVAKADLLKRSVSTPLGLDGNELRALCQLKWHRQTEKGEEKRKEERERG